MVPAVTVHISYQLYNMSGGEKPCRKYWVCVNFLICSAKAKRTSELLSCRCFHMDAGSCDLSRQPSCPSRSGRADAKIDFMGVFQRANSELSAWPELY